MISETQKPKQIGPKIDNPACKKATMLHGRTIPLPASVKSANSLGAFKSALKKSPFSRIIHDTVVSLLANHPNIQTDYYCILVDFIFYLRIVINVFLFITILLP